MSWFTWRARSPVASAALGLAEAGGAEPEPLGHGAERAGEGADLVGPVAGEALVQPVEVDRGGPRGQLGERAADAGREPPARRGARAPTVAASAARNQRSMLRRSAASVPGERVTTQPGRIGTRGVPAGRARAVEERQRQLATGRPTSVGRRPGRPGLRPGGARGRGRAPAIRGAGARSRSRRRACSGAPGHPERIQPRQHEERRCRRCERAPAPARRPRPPAPGAAPGSTRSYAFRKWPELRIRPALSWSCSRSRPAAPHRAAREIEQPAPGAGVALHQRQPKTVVPARARP